MSEIEIPPHLLTLRDEAQRLLNVLAIAIDTPATATLVTDFNRFTGSSCTRLAENIRQLEDILNGPLNEATSNSAGEFAAVYRAMGRVEQVLLQLASDRQTVRALVIDRNYDNEKQLLASAHLHVINDIRGGLQRIVDVLNNLPRLLDNTEPPANGRIELPIELTVTTPPELAPLVACMKAKATPWIPAPLAVRKPSRHRRPGALRDIGAVAIWVAILNVLLGGWGND